MIDTLLSLKSNQPVVIEGARMIAFELGKHDDIIKKITDIDMNETALSQRESALQA